MKKTTVIIINGKPRSGKDTAIKYLRQYCRNNECAETHHHSSIEYVKNILRKLGWDGNKDEESRNMLSALKRYWVDNCDGALKDCMEFIMSFARGDDDNDHVILIQIREPEEIRKLVDALLPIGKAYNINTTTLFIDRPDNTEPCTNDSDKNVGDYNYESTIINNGSLDHLEEMCYTYIENLLCIRRYGNGQD